MKHTRRATLKTIAYSGAGILLPSALRAKIKQLPRTLKFGVITDTHIGFVSGAEKRLEAFLAEMKKVRPNGLIQMGDFAHPRKQCQESIDAFNNAHKNSLHTIGNHDIKDHGLTRQNCKDFWGIPAPYYTKQIDGVLIIVLDGNEKGSPKHRGGYPSYIGKKQQDWLKEQLTKTDKPVIIVSHQPLAGRIAVDNAEEMQKILEPHKEKILVCLNGHSHVDQLNTINGINYLHINSASYYWLGGKVRLAKYKDPLFTTMTIDTDKGTVSFSPCLSDWEKGTPEDAGYFKDGKNKDLKDIVKPQISARKISRS